MDGGIERERERERDKVGKVEAMRGLSAGSRSRHRESSEFGGRLLLLLLLSQFLEAWVARRNCGRKIAYARGKR